MFIFIYVIKNKGLTSFLKYFVIIIYNSINILSLFIINSYPLPIYIKTLLILFVSRWFKLKTKTGIIYYLYKDMIKFTEKKKKKIIEFS